MRARDVAETVRPRYVIKRPAATVLFAFLATAAGFFADAKLVRTVAAGVRDRGIPLGILGIVVVVISAMLFLLVYLTLQVRYVLRAQAVVASCLFLLLTAGAASFGYAMRMRLAPPDGEQARAFSPSAYTPREALVALMLLAATGTIFSAAHNVAFLRKADYTEFGARRHDLLAFLADAAARYTAGKVLTTRDAKVAGERSTAALAALDKTAAADEPRYRRFVAAHIRPAVFELYEFIADPGVQQMPDLLLKACGLTRSTGALTQEQVARVSTAYRALEGMR